MKALLIVFPFLLASTNGLHISPLAALHQPSNYVCPTFPFCSINRISGLWSPLPELRSNNTPSQQRVVGRKSSDCWFRNTYCRSDDSELIEALSSDSPEECQTKCKENDDCLFFTFHRTRGQGKCYLLDQCSNQKRCPSVDDCASGHKTCTCPILDRKPEDNDSVKYARWICGDLNPYTTPIPVGTVCSTTCPSWKGSVQSTCLPAGRWSSDQPDSGRNLGYAGSLSSPDEEDMTCGCQDVGPFHYDPNSEDGASFICRNWSPDKYTQAGGWTITTSDRCDLFCNDESKPVVSVYCDETTWKGNPDLGFWCYKKPENSGSKGDKSKPKAIDGEWGSWQSWSHCSKKCGDGSRTRERTCSNPAPASGGKTCTGSSSESSVCNTNECQAQCSKPFKTIREAWRKTVYTPSGAKPCNRHCDKDNFTPGWYRFVEPAGVALPIAPPSSFGTSCDICQTRVSAWIKERKQPLLGDGIMDLNFCFAHFGNTCWRTNKGKAVACQEENGSEYFLYFLNKTPLCNIAYCSIAA